MPIIKLSKFRISRLDPWLLISVCLFLSLILFSFGSIPYLDGNIDFIKNYDFFSGGFPKLFQNWTSVHPPGKELITSLFFILFGINRYSYTLIGPFFGIIGIILFYLLASKLLGKVVARIGSLLLATNPLFISVGFFNLTDYLLTIFIIGAFYFYLKSKSLFLTIFLSLSFLIKETGLLIPISIIFVEIMTIKKPLIKNLRYSLTSWLSLGVPFFLAYLWQSFLKLQGKPLWSDWNFSETASRGSLYTVIHNITSFSLLNKYAYQNWLHLLVLNFNWVYWLILTIGLVLTLNNLRHHKINLSLVKSSTKTILSMLVFFFSYFFTVLSFQTYTIPRYVLPLLPLLILGTSWSIKEISKNLKLNPVLFLIPLLSIVCISLFFSLDPISSTIWGKEKIFSEEIYALRKYLAGNDGITYNMQYAIISKIRTKQIISANMDGVLISDDCYWVFPDPRNDQKTIQIINLKVNLERPCMRH